MFYYRVVVFAYFAAELSVNAPTIVDLSPLAYVNEAYLLLKPGLYGLRPAKYFLVQAHFHGFVNDYLLKNHKIDYFWRYNRGLK